MSMNDRAARFDALDQSSIDVLIVGAGINGASTFRELTLNGVSVLLVDSGDYCAGASAAPSRLIHGGLKYLENGEFRLVAESTHERNRLLLNAPHLVKPLPCTVPFDSWFGGLFSSAFRFLRLPHGHFRKRGTVIVKLGLMIYDWLGRKQRAMPVHTVRGRTQTHDLFPLLDPSVIASATYYDALITQPERLCLELVIDAERDSHSTGVALNYARVIGREGEQVVIRDEIDPGAEFQCESVAGGTSRDRSRQERRRHYRPHPGQGKREIRVTPRLVINAAGPWIDKVNRLFGIDQRYIGGSKGSHLILDHPELHAGLNGHMLYFETGDNRLCLAYPIGDRVLVGTTDIRIDDPDDARCEPEEVDYLFDVLAKLLPGVSITPAHIVYRYSGVRPLPYAGDVGIGSVSRDHSIEVEEPNDERPFAIASLIGGKWTTFRAFGEVAADLALDRLRRTRTRHTHDLAIGGGRGFPRDGDLSSITAQLSATHELSPDIIANLLQRHGCNLAVVEAVSAKGGATPLSSAPAFLTGEIHYLCRHEAVARLEDLVFRRTTLALEGRAGDAVVNEIGAIAAAILGWDSDRRDREVANCKARLALDSG